MYGKNYCKVQKSLKLNLEHDSGFEIVRQIPQLALESDEILSTRCAHSLFYTFIFLISTMHYTWGEFYLNQQRLLLVVPLFAPCSAICLLLPQCCAAVIAPSPPLYCQLHIVSILSLLTAALVLSNFFSSPSLPFLPQSPQLLSQCGY
jgi:hypothetical protein